jgi:hypothetical protein
MCSAARLRRGQKTRGPSLGLLALGVAAVLAGCSVYQSGLLDDAAAVTEGGSNSGGSTGASSSDGGKSGGGKSGEVSSGGSTDEPLGEAGGAGEAAGGATGSAGTTSEPTAGSGGTASGAGGGGGSAGAGGAPVVDPVGVLDGFEDDDIILEQTAGRGGVWYLFNDGSAGTVGPSPLVCSKLSGAPAALGMYAMHITATGFTGYGSGLGVDFVAGKKPYDGSKLSGVRFWARVGEGKNTRHRIQLVDASTDALGGKCNAAPNAPDGQKCDDHFGKNLVLTTSWTLYVVPFTDLTQVGFGTPATALDKAHLYGLQVTAKPKLEVDLWLDQFEFF